MGARSSIWLSRAKKGAIVIAIMVLLYAALGFLVAPWILKSKAMPAIADQLGRKLIAREIKVNPFALSVTIRGFEMSEPDGTALVGFEELYVNFQLSSIFRRAFTFAEVRLLAPKGQIKILPDGSLNFSDLLASSEQPDPMVNRRKGLPPVLIFRLQIDQGRLVFSDLSHPTPFEVILSPITFLQTNFSTQKDSKSPFVLTATTDKREALHWEGNISINPPSSDGRLTLTGIKTRTLWEYVQDWVRFEVTSGSIDVAARYSVNVGVTTIDVGLGDGELQLSSFELGEKGSTENLLSVPSLSIKGADVNLTNRHAMVSSIHVRDAHLKDWLDRDGVFQAQKMFAGEGLQQKAGPSGGDSAQPDTRDEPWKFTVRELVVENAGSTIENRAFAETLRVTLDPVNLTLKDLSNEKDSRAALEVSVGVNKTGTIGGSGLISINPPFAALDVQAAGIALPAFQPTFATVAQVKVVSGTANVKGQLKYQALGDGGPEARYEGGVRIDSLKVVDREFSEDFLQWESLSLSGVAFAMNPNRLSISEIIAKRPYVKVIIWADSTVNLTSVLAPPDDQERGEAALLAARPFEKTQGPMPISVGTVRVEDGSADFADLSLKPNFATRIQSLEGTISGLSSEPSTRADVLFGGKVGKYAPVKIAGQVNPLGDDRYADVKLDFRNMELKTVTPYSGKFLGYTIEKGKMTVDFKYKVEGNVLSGENEILVKQLTLGERIESPHATTLPVRLAIALLKDRKGNIELNLPVRGDLSNPQFDYGALVAKALRKVIAKIVTSPFALLASLVSGKAEDLSFVEFEFGSAVLREEQIEKLDSLAEALHKRPALRLEIKASADTEYDRTALAEAELLKQLRHVKLKELQAARVQVPAQAEEISLSEDDYARLVIQAYEKRFGKHPRALFGMKGEPPAKEGRVAPDAGQSPPTVPTKTKEASAIDPAVVVTAAKKRLIDGIAIDETRVRALAQDRAKQIKDYLIGKGQIQEERLVVVGLELDGSPDGNAVRADLGLSGK